jgi:hypothetical protein
MWLGILNRRFPNQTIGSPHSPRSTMARTIEIISTRPVSEKRAMKILGKFMNAHPDTLQEGEEADETDQVVINEEVRYQLDQILSSFAPGGAAPTIEREED